MAVYTCSQGGERVATQTILRASGEVTALVCPVHGVLAYLGWKPPSGETGTHAPDGTMTLQPCAYAKIGNRWLVRPPRGEAFWIGLPFSATPDGILTVNGFIDGAAWRGWLEDGVWLEEER
jgi:hypothetical protein